MHNTELEGIENIIFDLGNVIINLDIDATDKAFKKLLDSNYDFVINKLSNDGVFNQYEKGQISSEQFIESIQSLQGNLSKEQIKKAWNAMLKDIPEERFEILSTLKKTHRVFCLSNTNSIHIAWISEYLKKSFNLNSLDPYFERVYYSHLIGMRKPDLEIFDFVLNENNLSSEKTLFIDDTIVHLEAAKNVGIKTYHMNEQRTMEALFKNF